MYPVSYTLLHTFSYMYNYVYNFTYIYIYISHKVSFYLLNILVAVSMIGIDSNIQSKSHVLISSSK